MNMHHTELLPAEFSGDSRVWIYQASRLFTLSEAFAIEDKLEAFVREWNSHGTPVKGFANLFYGQFIILLADETATGVSGCSTDSSVRVIKDIEKTTGVSLFDRLNLAFFIKDRVQLIPMAQLGYAIENGFVDGDTFYFNNTVQTKDELEKSWLIPIKDSWLKNKFKKPVS